GRFPRPIYHARAWRASGASASSASSVDRGAIILYHSSRM
ncbi:MAG: hypothetical protein AVDCRST_MAG68-3574, partial [uncultured Gemmatimonadetes bacterium]